MGQRADETWALGVNYALAEAAKVKFDLRRLPDAVRNVYLVGQLEPTLMESSIASWLASRDADWADETVAALKLIGATRSAKTLSLAFSHFPGGALPTHAEDREDVAENVAEDVWIALTKRYLKVSRVEGVNALTAEYIEKNVDLFHLDRTLLAVPIEDEPPAPDKPWDAEALEALSKPPRKRK